MLKASPLGAVFMALLALLVLVNILPDQGVTLSWNTMWALVNTVGAIFEVGTHCALIGTLGTDGTDTNGITDTSYHIEFFDLSTR